MFSSSRIIYIVENAEWSIRWDGRYITKNINKLFGKNSRVYDIVGGISDFRNKILHFGSRSTYLPDNFKLVDSSNKIIFTWFHGTDEDREFIDSLPEGSKRADFIHTSCTITKKQLIKWGAQEEKIVVIPLGVDLSLFEPFTEYEKRRIRNKLGIPVDSICIGSFQKDGVGWDEGNTPKLEKGPDIFCEVIKKIKSYFPVFVLLTGPARGYVKNRLREIGVPYKHHFLKNYLDIPRYYNALDYYIITSRAEGGPKAILECSATGVPFVTTRVGMVDDIIVDEKHALVSEINDVKSLIKNFKRLVEDKDLREKLISNGLENVHEYDWKLIAGQYYEKMYSKLLWKE